MALTTVEKVDGKLILTLSDEAQQELKLLEGTTYALHRTDGGLGVRRPTFKLDDLLAQCDYSVPMDEEEREWVDAPRVGRELI